MSSHGPLQGADSIDTTVSKNGRTINDIVDELGFGLAQLRLCVLGGGVFFVDGVAMTLFMTLPMAISSELSMHPFQRALLPAGALLGKLCGNYANILTDLYMGRRKPIIIGYFVGICPMALSAFVYDYWMIVACWSLSGFGFGLALPAWNSLSAECSPRDKRMLSNGVSNLLFSMGSFCTFLVEFYFSSRLDFGAHWRGIITILQFPCVLLWLAAVFIGFPESPHVLLVQGNPDGAARQLDMLRQQNGRGDVDIRFDHLGWTPTSTKKVSTWNGFGALFSKRLFATTLVVCFSTFTLNFLGYGCGYGVPVVLPSLTLAVSPGLILCAGQISEVMGVGFGIAASRSMARRPMILSLIFLLTVTFGVLVFGLYTLNQNPDHSIMRTVVLVVFVGMQVLTAPLWLCVYVYASEVFPTMCRSFATGFVIGSGRFGSMLAPFAFEYLYMSTGTFLSFFGVLCGLLGVNMVLVYFVLRETKGCILEEFLGEHSELTPLQA